jgi:ABC-type multidrug transport system ATPase subunit
MLLKAGECLPPGRLWLWRGTRAILAILLARPNVIKVAAAGQQAFKAFAKAEELIPQDSDLLVQHASLLLHAPTQYGGDRDLGISKLRQAMQDSLYREHARRILADNGVLVEDEVLEAQPAQPAPHVSDTAPVLLQVDELEYRLSPAFTLVPGAFSLRRGERVALVGPNGSGKSMLLEVLLGLRHPGRGAWQWHFDGIAASSQITDRQRIGGLLQGADWPGYSKVSEIMALHRTVYARTEPAVTRALGLEELQGRYWRQLSRGQKQRVLLWLALSHVPEVALLDEPSLGLDEWHVRALRELLDQLPTSLLIISHVPADLLGANRVLCMEGGKIIAQGSLDELVQARVGVYRARISQTLSAQAVSALRTLPGLLGAPQQHDGVWQMHGSTAFDAAFRHFIAEQQVGAFSLEASSVEDFLASLAGGAGAHRAAQGELP